MTGASCHLEQQDEHKEDREKATASNSAKNKIPTVNKNKNNPRDKTTDCGSGRSQPILQHLQNNPDQDEFPTNNPTIRTQFAECEVAYYKIRHTNPVLADVDVDFYHSLPPVQVLLGEMTRLESLAMSLEANNTNPLLLPL